VSAHVLGAIPVSAILDLLATTLDRSASLVKRAQAGRELTAQQGYQLSRLLGRAADLASLHASITTQNRTTLRSDEQARVDGHQRAVTDFFASAEPGRND
jgi:hypothetical protein